MSSLNKCSKRIGLFQVEITKGCTHFIEKVGLKLVGVEGGARADKNMGLHNKKPVKELYKHFSRM